MLLVRLEAQRTTAGKHPTGSLQCKAPKPDLSVGRPDLRQIFFLIFLREKVGKRSTILHSGVFGRSVYFSGRSF